MFVPVIQTIIPSFGAVIVLATLFYVIRQAWQGKILAKLLAPTLALVFVALSSVIIYNTLTSIQSINESEILREEDLYAVFLGRISAKEDFSIALATTVANNPEVQVAFANRDRDRLTELTLNAYQQLDEQFGVPQHQFHLPPATSFLRLHNLEKYGDDLSSFRFTVLAANAEKRPVKGLEIGRGGLGVRGVVPVSYQGQHLGTVEFGVNVDQNLIDEMKAEYGSDWQILLSKEPAEIATFEGAAGDVEGPIPELLFQASTLETPIFAQPENYQSALVGTASIQQLEIEDQNVVILSNPLYDFSGNIIGVVDIVSDHTAVVQQRNTQITISIIIFIIALGVVGAGVYFITTITVRPIETLTNVSNAISAGDLSQIVPIESQDELGTLAQTFNNMTIQLRETLEGLEERVAARTKDLATVADISTVTATIRDPFQMLATMVQLTQRGFNLYHAHVFTYDKESDILGIVACGYKEGEEHEGTHGTTTIPIGQEQSLVALAARTRKPVIVNDVRNEPGWLPNPLLPETRAELAVPMIVGDELLGVLDVQSEYLDAFTEEDANIQMTLASQIATALQNARTYDRTQKRAELESLVNVIGQRIQRATSIEDTLQTAIRELGTAIGAKRVKASIQSASTDTFSEPVASYSAPPQDNNQVIEPEDTPAE